MGTFRRLFALARVPVGRVTLSIALGALAVGFGIALMTTAGYLISRAAERPPILSLTVTIVAVRFLGLARPLARYLERLVSHDVALRALGQTRARFFERIEPLAPAQLEGYRRGDLLARMVGDVDALQGLYLRGLAPPLVAIATGAASIGVAAAVLPEAGAILALGLVAGGVLVPAVAGALGRTAGCRQAAARAELTADLVEILRGGPELVVFGREHDTLERVRSRSGELARLGRRDGLVAGLADALMILVTGLTVAGVLAVAVAAHDVATLDRVLVATLALLALSSFEAVSVLPTAARELSTTLAAGRRVLELTDRKPVVSDPPRPLSPVRGRGAFALEGVTARYAPGEQPALSGFDLRLDPGRRIALVGPSGAGKTTVTSLLLRFLTPRRAASQSTAETSASTVRRTCAVRLRSPARTRTSSTRRSERTSASRARLRPTPTSRTRCIARESAIGSPRCPMGSIPSSARMAPNCQVVSGSASRWPSSPRRRPLADPRRAHRAPRVRPGGGARSRHPRRGRRSLDSAHHPPSRGSRPRRRGRHARRRQACGP